jgi:hypothetical protein
MAFEVDRLSRWGAAARSRRSVSAPSEALEDSPTPCVWRLWTPPVRRAGSAVLAASCTNSVQSNT